MRLLRALAISLAVCFLMNIGIKFLGYEKTLIIYHFVVCFAIGFLSGCKIKL